MLETSEFLSLCYQDVVWPLNNANFFLLIILVWTINFGIFQVYNRASCSLSWLERHVLSHGGNRPFKCIVDNCSQRFPTQAALQRHVNSHFESNSQGIKANKCRDDSFPKSFRRKKHLKYKKRSACGKQSFNLFL